MGFFFTEVKIDVAILRIQGRETCTPEIYLIFKRLGPLHTINLIKSQSENQPSQPTIACFRSSQHNVHRELSRQRTTVLIGLSVRRPDSTYKSYFLVVVECGELSVETILCFRLKSSYHRITRLYWYCDILSLTWLFSASSFFVLAPSWILLRAAISASYHERWRLELHRLHSSMETLRLVISCSAC